MPKVLLLDGHSLTYRAFFALPSDMATMSGQVTNAVFGFTSMLINLYKDHQPDGLVVTFDRPEPTFRHEMVKDYKAGRQETPDILRQQMGLVRQVLEALHIPILEKVGFEADDILATLATQGRDEGIDVIVVTGDRDAYQLVEDPHIRVLYNRRGVSDYALYDEAGIKERTGVVPHDYANYAALRGDPSDNLPGVPGVGEKTAARLINDYGDLDGIYANLDKCTPKLRENLAANEAQARSNAAAIPLVRDVPLESSITEFTTRAPWDADEVKKLFAFLEFRTLWDRLVEAVGEGGVAGAGVAVEAEALVVHLSTATTSADAVAALSARPVGGLAVVGVWSGRAGRSPLLGLAVATDPIGGSADGGSTDGVWAGADPAATWIPAGLLADAAVRRALAAAPVLAHDAKPLLRSLAALGCDVPGLVLDTAIAAYLIEPADASYPLDRLAAERCGIELRPPDAPPAGQLALDAPASSAVGPESANTLLAGRSAVAVARLADVLVPGLEARGLRALWDDIERPLVRVLARMEDLGVRVDTAYLAELVAGLTEEVHALDAEIQEMAGHPFTVNSTPQLRTVLFDELGLAPSKKTKTGFSTDAASLEKLVGEHPIIDKLLRYREVEKLRSTYGEALLSTVDPFDGRIHATFHQTVARTGRLSSEEPNLHNIPVRSEDGRRFRTAFIPADGCELLVADYNQIELRVIAHLAQDPGLIESFRTGRDIHTDTASRVFGVEAADVTFAQRSKAKMVSYGLAYGMESYGLAQRLAIPVEEASEILKAYFVAFPAVKSYMDRIVHEARDRGYTETLFGRRRQIPELSSPNFRIRQAGERQAMNAGIQGLAADIFKVALVVLDKALEDAGMRSRIVLQVHDEIIVEVPPEEHVEAGRLVLEAMRGATSLDVPLEVNLSWGTTWAAAKG